MRPKARALLSLGALRRCTGLTAAAAEFRGSGVSGDVWCLTEAGLNPRVFKVFRDRAPFDEVQELRMALWAQRTLPDYCVGFVEARAASGRLVAEMPVIGIDLYELCVDQGIPPPRRRIALIQDVTAAVAALHRHNTLHNDIKPENVLVEEGTGRARLIDFGCACRGPTRDVGVSTGTAGYRHPRLRRGNNVSVSTDAYALMRTVEFLCGVECGPVGTWGPLRRVGALVENHTARARAFPHTNVAPQWSAALLACCRADSMALGSPASVTPSRIHHLEKTVVPHRPLPIAQNHGGENPRRRAVSAPPAARPRAPAWSV